MEFIALNNCEKNKFYYIVNLDCKQIAVARRLTELGFVENAQVKIIQFSALKKTLLIELEGYILSLRSSIAETIKVKK